MNNKWTRHLFLFLAMLFASAGQAIADDGNMKGDANGDEVVNVTDAVVATNQFHNIVAPACPLNADANGDGVINMTDVVVIINLYHYGSVNAGGTINGWTEGNTPEEQQEEELTCD